MAAMFLAASTSGSFWHRVGSWFAHEGLSIALIIGVAFALTRLVTLVAKRRIKRIVAQRLSDGEVTAATYGAHQQALVGASRWALNFSIVAVASVLVLMKLHLPAAALVPLASVVGAGLGFGAQQIVGDVLTGIFILSERQFGVGDVVRVGPLIAVGWIEGRVEEVTLRVTKLRTFDGDVVNISNGELRLSVNMSRDWARVLVTVPLDRDVDLDAITLRLNAEGEALAADPAWSSLVLEPPAVAGLDDLGAETIEVRVVGRSLPAQQWKVARELRRRIAMALREMHVSMQDPVDDDVISGGD
jgi:small conductance mechanosensitive channel